MNKYLLLLPLLVLVGCSSSETESESSGTAAAASDRSKCALGTFDFRTTKDGKKHFDARFGEDGIVYYNLNGAPKRTYEINGEQITFVGPFGPNRSDQTLTWTVSQGSAAECNVRQFRGKSKGGSDMTATR